MNLKQLILAAGLGLAPLAGWSVETCSNLTVNACSNSMANSCSNDLAMNDPGAVLNEPAGAEMRTNAVLAPAALEVIKLAKAGTSPEVVKAFVDSSSSAFNLTAEGVIALKNEGIAEDVIAAMLAHDKNARNPMQTAAPPGPYNMTSPATQETPAQGSQATQPSDDQLYNSLAPYGNWNYMSGYGLGWQPYSWNSYPWWWMGWGSWNFVPSFGWWWFPRSSFFFRGGFFAHRGFFFNKGFNRGFKVGVGFNNFNRGGFRSGFNRGVRGPFVFPSPRNGVVASPFAGAGVPARSFAGRGFAGGAAFHSGGFHGAVGFHGGGGGFHGGGGHR